MTTNTNSPDPIRTGNEAWGFYGVTFRRLDDAGESGVLAATETLFADAARGLVELLALSPEDAVFVLDSRLGRHLADARLDVETGFDLIERLGVEWSGSIARVLREVRA